jgi:hypothetical protein
MFMITFAFRSYNLGLAGREGGDILGNYYKA